MTALNHLSGSLRCLNTQQMVTSTRIPFENKNQRKEKLHPVTDNCTKNQRIQTSSTSTYQHRRAIHLPNHNCEDVQTRGQDGSASILSKSQRRRGRTPPPGLLCPLCLQLLQSGCEDEAVGARWRAASIQTSRVLSEQAHFTAPLRQELGL